MCQPDLLHMKAPNFIHARVVKGCRGVNRADAELDQNLPALTATHEGT
jgi:hypothetical protein